MSKTNTLNFDNTKLNITLNTSKNNVYTIEFSYENSKDFIEYTQIYTDSELCNIDNMFMYASDIIIDVLLNTKPDIEIKHNHVILTYKITIGRTVKDISIQINERKYSGETEHICKLQSQNGILNKKVAELEDKMNSMMTSQNNKHIELLLFMYNGTPTRNESVLQSLVNSGIKVEELPYSGIHTLVTYSLLHGTGEMQKIVMDNMDIKKIYSEFEHTDIKYTNVTISDIISIYTVDVGEYIINPAHAIYIPGYRSQANSRYDLIIKPLLNRGLKFSSTNHEMIRSKNKFLFEMMRTHIHEPSV